MRFVPCAFSMDLSAVCDCMILAGGRWWYARTDWNFRRPSAARTGEILFVFCSFVDFSLSLLQSIGQVLYCTFCIPVVDRRSLYPYILFICRTKSKMQSFDYRAMGKKDREISNFVSQRKLAICLCLSSRRTDNTMKYYCILSTGNLG